MPLMVKKTMKSGICGIVKWEGAKKSRKKHSQLFASNFIMKLFFLITEIVEGHQTQIREVI